MLALCLRLCCLWLAAPACSAAAPPSAAREESPYSGVRIKGDPAFLRQARAALSTVAKTSCGAKLLGELAAAKRWTIVRRGSQEHNGATLSPLGQGDSVILWDPEFKLPSFPAFLFLYHELIHALHEAKGDALPYLEEERRAVGLPPHEKYPLSENAMRKELKLPPRRGNGWEEFPGRSPEAR